VSKAGREGARGGGVKAKESGVERDDYKTRAIIEAI